MRAKRRTPAPKEDLSWSEVGELAYGYLRIPLVLLIVEVIYWWATDPAATFEPYQAGIASLWTFVSNLFWPGSAEMVYHGPSQAFTGVNLYHESFLGGIEPMYVSDECVGIHEIVFLSVLMLLTPGVGTRTRWRSIAGMTLIVQLLNFSRLMVLYPIATRNGVGEMLAFHEFILSSGFLAILVLIWLGWYLVLDRKGLIDRTVKPSLKDLPDFRSLRLRDSLPSASIAIIVCAILIAGWSTYESAIDEDNLKLKASAENCEYDDDENQWTNEYCFDDRLMWEDVWGRSVRGWLFSGLLIGAAIVTTEPLPSSEEE